MSKSKSKDWDTAFAVCIKDRDGPVLNQNPTCKQICGNREGQVCKDRCMLRYIKQPDRPSAEEGIQSYPNQIIDGELFDITFINDRSHLITLLYPLNEKIERELKELRTYGLTPQELRVAEFILKGHTNSDIERRLNVTRSTLKSHLRNLYQKLPLGKRSLNRDLLRTVL